MDAQKLGTTMTNEQLNKYSQQAFGEDLKSFVEANQVDLSVQVGGWDETYL